MSQSHWLSGPALWQCLPLCRCFKGKAVESCWIWVACGPSEIPNAKGKWQSEEGCCETAAQLTAHAPAPASRTHAWHCRAANMHARPTPLSASRLARGIRSCCCCPSCLLNAARSFPRLVNKDCLFSFSLSVFPFSHLYLLLYLHLLPLRLPARPSGSFLTVSLHCCCYSSER